MVVGNCCVKKLPQNFLGKFLGALRFEPRAAECEARSLNHLCQASPCLDLSFILIRLCVHALIRSRCTKAKGELSANLHHRMKWVVYIQNQVFLRHLDVECEMLVTVLLASPRFVPCLNRNLSFNSKEVAWRVPCYLTWPRIVVVPLIYNLGTISYLLLHFLDRALLMRLNQV